MGVLLKWVFRVTGVHRRQSRRLEAAAVPPAGAPLIGPWLLIGSALELALVGGFVLLLASPEPSSALHLSGMPAMHMGGLSRMSLIGDPTAGAGLVAALALLGLLALMMRAAVRWGADIGPRQWTGAACAASGGVWWLLTAGTSSHAAMMLQMELVMTLGPALLMCGRRVGETRPWLAWVGAIGFPLVLVVTHLSPVHDQLSGSPVLRIGLLAGQLAAGLSAWSVILSDRYRMRIRIAVLGVVLEAGGLLSLALLLSSKVLLPHMAGDTLAPLTDQRLAGAVMMLGDIAVILVVLRSRFSALGRLIERPGRVGPDNQPASAAV